jgi:MFS transporter, SHS family, sialic acid transporter
MRSAEVPSPVLSPPLSTRGRIIILVAAFLGWFFAGFHLASTSLVMQSAAIDLLARDGALDRQEYERLGQRSAAWQGAEALQDPDELRDQQQWNRWRQQVARWFAWYQCAFLFGAAAGGFCFGRLGDRIGRSKAMALSILTYSLLAACASLATSPWQLLVWWFLACTGVGGMWPNGVALVAEAWSNLSRPLAAGVIGTSANIGIFLMATLAARVAITPDSWRWMLQIASAPALLGLFTLLVVPESPRWLAARETPDRQSGPRRSSSQVFRPPWLRVTLLGIILATVPLIGGWGSANWMVPWAGEAGAAATPPDPHLKAHVQQARALTGIAGSLLGGWFASFLGRRRAYAVSSLACLLIAQYAFWFVVPTDAAFLFWVAALGFFSGLFFGWLPLFLPELFPVEVRSTGAGVSFNFGRILTAVTIFATGTLMELFAGDYARIGRVTSLIFAVGLVAIYFAPDTSRQSFDEEPREDSPVT